MKKSTKVWLIAAACLTALGLILFVGVLAAYNLDFTNFSTVKYKTNTYEVSGAFDKISIDVETTEVEFAPSEDDRCTIVCFETEKVKHSAAVEDGTLTIGIVDTRKWYDHIGISIGSPRMTVYLPQTAYASLLVDTDTGDIRIPEDFSFENIEITGDTADVICYASASALIEISTDTGDVHINSITSEGNIAVETDTGEIGLTDVTGKSVAAESDTGDIALKNVVADSFFIQNATGDVRLESSDAAQISVKTSTGDVIGTLLTQKVFITETSTGRVSVPKTAEGGRCEIITSTGDIVMDIQ